MEQIPFTRSTLPLIVALKAIGYQGRLSVEAFATDSQPIATSAHVRRDTSQSKDQVTRDAFAFLRRHWAEQ